MDFDEAARIGLAQTRRMRYQAKLYYTLDSALGIDWATWIWAVGARGRGKSFSALETVTRYYKKYGAENVKIYYFRISDLSVQAMLANRGSKAVDAKIQRKYGLELSVHGNVLHDHEKPFITFYPLVSAAKKGKGVAEYDDEFLGNRPIDPKTGKPIKRFVFIIIDEFMMAEGLEKKSVGNPVDQFKIYIENILRDQERLDYPAVRIFGCANAVSECSDFLSQLCNFIPEKPGRYFLKRRHAIVDNIENSQAYIEKRKKSIGGDIMDYENDSNYTNVVKRDLETLKPKNRKLRKPTAIIKFTKDKSGWFTVWDSEIIKKYSGQVVNQGSIIAMRRYLDTFFSEDLVLQVIERYDARGFLYNDLISQSAFASYLKQIKK